MKANEAPEKIYVNITHPISDEYTEMIAFEDGDGIEYTRTGAFMKKAKEAFCKATCNGHPPRSTCTSLGTCKEYDEFIKAMKL